MLKGDLATTPLPEVLRALATRSATGCLRAHVGGTSDAKVFLRGGRVYAVLLPDRRPQLGPRLVSSGDLDPAALAEAYDAQATELQGWRLGELLVHLGYVEQDVVEAAVGEQLREAAFELLLFRSGTWRFRVDERTREDVAPPVDVEELLADTALLLPAWEALRPHVHGPDAVPVLSAAGTSPDTLSLDGDAWSLLCTVDGTSSLSRLAGSSGLSLLEAAQVVVTLVEAGLVEIDPVEVEVEAEVEEPPVVEVVEVEEPEPVDELPVAELPAPAAIASRLADALRGLGPVPVLPPLPALDPAPAAPSGLVSTAMDGESLTRALETDADEVDVEDHLTRASASLSESLGETTEVFDPFALPEPVTRHAPLAPLDEKEAARRARDAQELADRHAALEAEHAAQLEAERTARLPDAHLAAQWQAAAFAELSEAASATPPDDVVPAVEPAPAPAEQPAAEPTEPDAWDDQGQVFDPPPRGADTAALLRELSSLGLDDEANAVPEQRASAPHAVRPAASVGPKKRKGLFGR